MATPQLSPGVLVREVDLTIGRADNVLDNIGAIAGPFVQGPVNEPTDIATEQDLINVFVPTTPNPTSGFLLMFPKEEVIFLDMTFEEASKFIVSAGTSDPADN